MLRLTGNAVHFGATFTMSLIGHFFYTLLFGVAGGDLAKSALYASWYQLPLPEILAAAPLDRLLGFGGLIIFIILSFSLAAWNGAFFQLNTSSLHISTAWILITLVLIGLAVALFMKFGRIPGVAKWLQALRFSLAQMMVSKSIVLQGVACGFLVQVGLAGSLALSLQAVSHTEIPWGQLLWTFPIICIISAVPFTVAGLGFREGAALSLLGLYGISPADAVAASLLTLVGRLAWAAVGGMVLWKERQFQTKSRPLPRTISVIIPTYNEAQCLPETIHHARAIPEVSEIIVVDGGSKDGTREVAAALGCKVMQCAPGRGGQMRLGAAQASGDIVLLLHADTWLSANAGRAAISCLRDVHVAGGGFWKQFRAAPALLLGSRLKCAIRLYLGRRILGDQTMFFRRETLESVGGVPDMPLMEEFELCRRLRRVGRIALAESTVLTSARRFTRRGVIRTYLLMWRVTWRYRLGASPQELRKLYEQP